MKFLRFIIMAMLLAFLTSLVWGQASKKPRFPASAYKTTAKIELQNPKLQDSAVVILEEGVSCYPSDAEMHFLLGKAYSYKNNYLGMGEQFAIADSLKSKKDKWVNELDSLKTVKWQQVYNQGAKAFNEKDYDTALDKFVTSTIINPTDFRGLLHAGLAHMMKKQYEQAIPYLKAGLKLNPDNPELLQRYADVLLYSGKQKEALESYDKVLEKDPKNVEVLINLVSIYSNAKDYEQALSYSKKLVGIDTTYKDGYFNMGTIYLQKIVETNIALDSLKDPSGGYLKDEKSMARKEELIKKKNDYFSSAQSAFEKATKLDTTDMEAHIYLAQVYQEQENFDQALRILEPLVLRDTANCDAWNQLAVIYAKKGAGEKAKQSWQKAQDCLNRPK